MGRRRAGIVKIKSISLNEDEMPESVTVELSLREALFIGLAIGVHNDPAANAILPGGHEQVESVYYGLTGGLFNRFWHDGIEGAKEGEQGDGE